MTSLPYVACDAFIGGALGDEWALGQVSDGLAVRFPLSLPVPDWPDAVDYLRELAVGDAELCGEVTDRELEPWIEQARSPFRTAGGARVAGMKRLINVELVRQGLRIVRPATPSGPWTARIHAIKAFRRLHRIVGESPTKLTEGEALSLERSGWRLLVASMTSWAAHSDAPELKVRKL